MIKNIKKTKSVIVYSTPSCSWCTKLKKYLKKNNIKFKDVNVAKNAKAAFDLQRRSGQVGVPQTEINGKIIVGFDKAKIDKILCIKK